MSGGGHGGGGYGQPQGGFGSYNAGGNPDYGSRMGAPTFPLRNPPPNYGSRLGWPTLPLQNPPQPPQMTQQYQLGQGAPRYASQGDPNAINLTGFGPGGGGQNMYTPPIRGGLQYQPPQNLAQMSQDNMALFNNYGQQPQSVAYQPKGGLMSNSMESAPQPSTQPVSQPNVNVGVGGGIYGGGMTDFDRRSLSDPQWGWQQMLAQYAKEDAARAPEGPYNAGAARVGLRAQFGR